MPASEYLVASGTEEGHHHWTQNGRCHDSNDSVETMTLFDCRLGTVDVIKYRCSLSFWNEQIVVIVQGLGSPLLVPGSPCLQKQQFHGLINHH
jgi:hypothetical protein